MKYVLVGLLGLSLASVLATPASAMTCPPGTTIAVVKSSNGKRMVCISTMAAKKRLATPKPQTKHA